MRWWKEFRNPGLKCKRVNFHPERVERRETYRDPQYRASCIADECTETRVVCGHCGKEISPWTIMRRRGIQGLEMSRAKWDEIRDKGFTSA